MKTIKLYGHLGKEFGKIHKYEVNTVSEAISLLCINYKGFKDALVSFKGEGYRVIINNEDITAEELQNNFGAGTFKIVPVISGQGDSSTNMILLGALLVVAAPWALGTVLASGTGTALTVGGALGTNLLVSSAVVHFGTALILAGISQMLYSPPPVEDNIQARRAEKGSFNGAVNTTRQGVPVPVGYGRLLVGSAVISAGLSAVSVPVGTSLE